MPFLWRDRHDISALFTLRRSANCLIPTSSIAAATVCQIIDQDCRSQSTNKGGHWYQAEAKKSQLAGKRLALSARFMLL